MTRRSCLAFRGLRPQVRRGTALGLRRMTHKRPCHFGIATSVPRQSGNRFCFRLRLAFAPKGVAHARIGNLCSSTRRSYAAALRDSIVETLTASGHSVDLCELYKEGFDPILSAHERRAYRDTSANFKAVSDHVQRLRQAEGAIFVFPSWWYGMPAILKGYFDRVWLPGVAFEFGPQAIKPLLSNIRLFGVVTTTGAPEWFTRIYMGNPSRKVF
jgi:NAD(P)H dehydrogenase (quinone)